ncbi:MAG: hypothetical protein P8183_19470 [Anaerolineae bacterium]
MMKRIFRWSLIFLTISSVLALVFVAAAKNSVTQELPAKGYEEGIGYSSAGSRVSQPGFVREVKEGLAGSAGRASFPEGDAWTALAASANLSEVYRFSGISDDGEQGSANRKEATSIHCTNISSANNQVEVRLYQWNGTDVFTGTVNMPPNRTFTFSTQNTTIYFDDVLLGGSPGTDAIFQGNGVVLAQSPQIVCSVQVLDPLNYPPVFAVGLEIYKR